LRARKRALWYEKVMMTRREAIKTVALTAGAIAVTPSLGNAAQGASGYPFKLPELGYAYDALEPYIDAQTMQIHHDKHHAAYVENLNKALADAPDSTKKMSVEQILASLDTLPEKIRTTVRNNAGGHYNHSLFWKLLKKNENGKSSGDLAKAIDTSFGSFSAFQEKLSEAATKVFGSGWAWLVLKDGKTLEIVSTPNQDSPISQKSSAPILGLDVWEHSYYLKHQNRRPEYIKAFWSVVNWDHSAELYAAALKA
jgi:Fe-Mn family superoxide dismutase